MTSPAKCNGAEQTYSEDLAEQIDMETGEPLELEPKFSPEALEEVKAHAKAAYWASCTGPADEVYKCTCPNHFGLCQFWKVLPGYKPMAVLYPTAKKWC